MHTSSIHGARAAARRALLLVLTSAVAAWALFVVGSCISLLISRPTDASFGYIAPGSIEYPRLVYVAAVAVFGIGSLIALRRAARLRAAGASTALARPVQRLASTSIIIAAAISTIVCISLFFSGFLAGDSETRALTQSVNLYLPIVLHTALVVTLMLAGFVFTPRGRADGGDSNSNSAVAASDSTAAAAEVVASAEPSEDAQRATALGFAVPLITAAAALIAGLIVADVIGSATPAWLWTIVLAVIGAGIVMGTRMSRRALEQQRTDRPRGPAVGARNLNFVFSIVLVSSATFLSFGYGVAAVNALQASPWLSVNVFSGVKDSGSDSASATWSVNGSDLSAGSDVLAVFLPGSIVPAQVTADHNGWVTAEGPLPSTLAAGDYQFKALGTARDGREIEAVATFTVSVDGNVEESDGSYGYSDIPPQIIAPSARWVFAELVPAGFMLLIATLVVGLTITTRAREQVPAAEKAPSPRS